MDSKVISFISCVNNDEYYNQCLSYIDKLEIPAGYSIEKIDIRGESSMCSGYNVGMKKAKGKYKVYIHQDAGIVNKNFIRDMLKVFEDNSVGLMGVIGSTELDESGTWWVKVDSCIGMVRHFGGDSPIFRNPTNVFEDVVAVDGLLIATQFDIPWREDILNGFHFYDISQCMEFYKAKLRVVVPRQEEIWVRHGFDCRASNLQGYETNRLITVNEYKEIYMRKEVKDEIEDIVLEEINEKIKEAPLEETPLVIEKSLLDTEVKLYVISHVNSSFIKAESIYPIASNSSVGKELGIIGTDTLDNVSCDNNLLAELSSLYWIWKNDKSSKYVGIFNYNKYLVLSDNPKILDSVYHYGWESENVKAIFENYDIVLPKILDFEMTIYEQYNICHKDKLLDLLMDIVKNKYPWVKKAFERALDSKSGYYFNLFIMRKIDFDNYMAFAFDIFEEIKDKAKEPLLDKSLSYLGERLLNCYVEYLKEAHNFKIKEVDILYY